MIPPLRPSSRGLSLMPTRRGPNGVPFPNGGSGGKHAVPSDIEPSRGISEAALWLVPRRQATADRRVDTGTFPSRVQQTRRDGLGFEGGFACEWRRARERILSLARPRQARALPVLGLSWAPGSGADAQRAVTRAGGMGDRGRSLNVCRGARNRTTYAHRLVAAEPGRGVRWVWHVGSFPWRGR